MTHTSLPLLRKDTIVVTGMGAFCSIGADIQAFWASLRAGRDGMCEVEGLDPAFSARFAALLSNESKQRLQEAGLGEEEPCVGFALMAAREAISQAKLDKKALASTGLVFGTGMGNHAARMRYNELYESTPLSDERFHTWVTSQFGMETALVAEALGLGGPRLALSTACASSANALGLARDLLQAGVVERVLVVGSDPFAFEVFSGFYSLGVMSNKPCAPFGEPVGMNIGEGAGAILLEKEDDAQMRGAPISSYLRGYGLSVDSFHPTTPEPTGKGIAQSIQSALSDAGMFPEEIGYYNAHGTGTSSNDAAEWKGVQQAFGEHAADLPVSSTKSYLGHAQGAAGILEAIATILALREQVFLPTLHLDTLRRQAPNDPVAEDVPRPGHYEAAVSNNSAFGGLNATVVLARRGPPEPQVVQRDAVYLLASSGIAAHGMGSLLASLRAGRPLRSLPDASSWLASEVTDIQAGFVPKLEDRRVLRRGETKGMDDISRFLTLATAATLQEASLSIRGDLRVRTGMFVGTSRMPAESGWRFWETAQERGWHRAPAHEFSRLVLNAPAGACSLALSLRGPGVTLVGADTGLLSAFYGAWWLSERSDTSLLFVGGCDQLGFDELQEMPRMKQWRAAERALLGRASEQEDALSLGDSFFLGEGAGIALLARGDFCSREKLSPRVRVASTSLAGSGKVEELWSKRIIFPSAQGQAEDAMSLEPPEAVFCAHGFSPFVASLRALLVNQWGEVGQRIPVWDIASVFGYARATSSALALVGAYESLCEEPQGEADTSLWGRGLDGRSPSRVWVLGEDELYGSILLCLERGSVS
ncbi:MAG: hypothetical protein H6727_03765 [Myxococcales bacterium]|nr:hypothetical protein [Myxococcales bacterium]